MAYPTTDFVKILNQKVDDLDEAFYQSHPQDRGCLHGVVEGIEITTDGSRAWLVVAPYWPTVLHSMGDLEFTSTKDHPLANVETPEGGLKSRYDKVYPVSIPVKLTGLYYKRGQVIQYYPYYGGSIQSDDGSGNTQSQYQIIQGSYVTVLEDTSFYARISLHSPGPTTLGSGCDDPLTLTGQYAYDFTAVEPNWGALSVDDTFRDYTYGVNGTNKFEGFAYNRKEAMRTTGMPVDQQIVVVTPLINDDSNVPCPQEIWRYWFDVAPVPRWVKVTANGNRPGSYKGLFWNGPSGEIDVLSNGPITISDVGTEDDDDGDIWIFNLQEMSHLPSDASLYDISVGAVFPAYFAGNSNDLSGPDNEPLPCYVICDLQHEDCG